MSSLARNSFWRLGLPRAMRRTRHAAACWLIFGSEPERPMTFLKLTHHNTKKVPVIDEEIIVNMFQIKYISNDAEGGSLIHFCNDEMPCKVLESIDEILEGVEDDSSVT